MNAAQRVDTWPLGGSRLGVFLITFVLCLGLLLRVSHLERKAYWGDEVYSSLRVLGFKTTEVSKGVATGQPILAAAAQQYLQPAPNKDVADTVNVLVQEDAHLTPLYFVLGRLWVDGFGASVVAMRSLSVLFSLLTLPAFYWLSRELFNSVPIARLSVILNVVSPIYLVYAQEARMYSLWSLTSVVAMAALLQAIRQNTWKSWGLLSIALTLQFYAHLFSVGMLLAYGLYVLGLKIASPATVSLRRFSLSVAAALVAFSPWFWVFFHRVVQPKFEESAVEPGTVFSVTKHLAGTFIRLFVDFNANSKTPWPELMGSLGVGIICLGVVLYGMAALYRETNHRVWLLIVLVIGVAPLGPIYAYHSLLLSPRYLLPGYVGLELIAAYILGTRVLGSTAGDRSATLVGNLSGQPAPRMAGRLMPDRRQQLAWSAVLSAIVAIGILSCGQIVMSETWWNKQYSNCNPKAAQLINQSQNPLVISDINGGPFFDHPLSNILSLSSALKPSIHLQIFDKQNYPEIASGFSDRFVITPSPTLRTHLEKNYGSRFQEVYAANDEYRGSSVCLWKITN
jgi:uncharacterized membrane protein